MCHAISFMSYDVSDWERFPISQEAMLFFLPRERIFVFWLFSRIKFCFKPRRTLNGSQETLLGSFLWLDVSSNKYRKLAFFNFSPASRHRRDPASRPFFSRLPYPSRPLFSRAPAPCPPSHTDVNGAGTRDEPLPLAKQSTGYAFTNGYKNFLNESGDECCKSSSRLSRKSFVRLNNGAGL